MFSHAGSLSASSGSRGLFIGAAAFAFGLIVGATALGPLFLASKEIATPTAAPLPPMIETDASAVPAPTPVFGRGIYPAEVLRIADGDTFEARVQAWPGIAITTMVRLRGIDTPELKARCAEERVKAEAARAKLAAILAEGSVELRAVGLDKFGGRIDAAASTRSTPDVSAALLRAGLGRSYTGGRRESWCS
jgi:endonuclease YncB( thermonuclease family)